MWGAGAVDSCSARLALQVRTHKCIYIHTHACLWVWVPVHTRADTCICIHTNIYIHTRINSSTGTQTNKHTCHIMKTNSINNHKERSTITFYNTSSLPLHYQSLQTMALYQAKSIRIGSDGFGMIVSAEVFPR